MDEAIRPKNILIIDDDESVGVIFKQILSEAGIDDVTTALSGQIGWEALRKTDYEFVILDWKLPDVTGLALVNRIRQHKKFYKIPILVCSGFTKAQDLSLLQEFLMAGMMEKPVQKGLLLRKITELMVEAKWVTNKEASLTQLFMQLEHDPKQTVGAIDRILKDSSNPLPIVISAAKILIKGKHWDVAESVLRKILERFPDSTMALNELGKVKLHQKEYKDAKRILLKAQRNSSENIERLNVLGNVSLHLMEVDEAEDYFNQALTLDPASKTSRKGKNIVDNFNMYSSQSGASAPGSFASMLNAVGIAMVKDKEYKKGIEHYESALGYVQDDLIKAKLSYNLALAYIKWNKKSDAGKWLSKAVALDDGYDKAKELLAKIESAEERKPKKVKKVEESAPEAAVSEEGCDEAEEAASQESEEKIGTEEVAVDPKDDEIKEAKDQESTPPDQGHTDEAEEDEHGDDDEHDDDEHDDDEHDDDIDDFDEDDDEYLNLDEMSLTDEDDDDD